LALTIVDIRPDMPGIHVLLSGVMRSVADAVRRVLIIGRLGACAEAEIGACTDLRVGACTHPNGEGTL
jgi:hypothetical protein